MIVCDLWWMGPERERFERAHTHTHTHTFACRNDTSHFKPFLLLQMNLWPIPSLPLSFFSFSFSWSTFYLSIYLPTLIIFNIFQLCFFLRLGHNYQIVSLFVTLFSRTIYSYVLQRWGRVNIYFVDIIKVVSRTLDCLSFKLGFISSLLFSITNGLFLNCNFSDFFFS